MPNADPKLSRPLVYDADDKALIDRIIAPMAPTEKHGITVNEGYRYLALGETGSGKTSLMRAAVYSTIAAGYARFALVHDCKGIFPEYPRSIQLENTQAFIARGGFRRGDIPVVSFRGDARRDIEVSVEEVCALSLMMARKGITDASGKWHMNPHVCVVEELSEGTGKDGKVAKGASLPKIAGQGRKIGIALVGTTQRPKKSPEDVITQSSCISFGRLTGMDANYLADVLELDTQMVNAIRGPSGQGLPNHQFVLWSKGEDWDGQIHKLSARTVAMFE